MAENELASALAQAVAADDPAEVVADVPALESAEPAPPVESASDEQAPVVREDGRDDKGRFAPKAKADEPAPAGQEAAPPPTSPQAEPAPQPAAAAPNQDVAPDTFSAAGKLAYKDASPDLKKEIWKREQDMRAGLQQYRESHQVVSTLLQSCSPYIPAIQASGSNLSQAIPYALQKVYEINTNPAASILQIAAQANIDLSQLVQQGGQQQANPELMQLRQQLAEMQQQLHGNQQSVQQEQERQGQQLIEQFRSDPKNLYFSNVEPQVLGLLRSGLVQGATPLERLNNAYAQACRLNDEVSAAINAQQQREAEQKRFAEAKAKAASAKRAGFDVAGSGALAGKAARDMSLEDSLRANLGL